MKLDFIFKIGAALRRGLFWVHLGVGLAAGAVILVMSVTGVLLSFQRQVTTWADGMPAMRAADGAGISLGRLLDSAREEAGTAPTAVVVPSDAETPITVMVGREAPVFLDPHTGHVVGRGSSRVRRFFQATTEWHRWLAASGDWRDAGRAVTGAANLAFLFIVASGLFLWWPRRWSRPALAAVTVPRLRLSGRVRDFNWHNALGFWSAAPLLVIVSGGVVISYPWASDLVYRAFGEPPPPKRAAAATRHDPAGAKLDVEGVDRLLAGARKQLPEWSTITLRLPVPASGPVTFTIDARGSARPQHRAQVALDRSTAEVVRWEPYEGLSRGRQTRVWMRWAHTGEAFGIVGQTIAGLASANAVVLACTGFALAWRRLRAWRASRAAASIPITLDPSIDSGGLS